MDEMGTEFGGIVTVVLALLSVSSLVVLVVAVWLGMRRVLRGTLRRTLWTTNILIFINSWLAILSVMENARFENNPALWVIGGIAGPALLGYALGTSIGLLRTRRGAG